MRFDKISGAQTVNVSTDKFETVQTSINEILENNDGSPVENTQIANLAIAVGLREDRREEPDSPNKPLKLESLDQDDVLKTIIERRHDDASPEELKEILGEYLEGGTREIYEDVDEENYFQYHRYLDIESESQSP